MSLGKVKGKNHIQDFNFSVDVKKFSFQRKIMTPSQNNTGLGMFKRPQDRSIQRIRKSQPSSLDQTFSKNVSQKNIRNKRKLSSGFQIQKNNPYLNGHHHSLSHHHSLALDHHLLKQRIFTAKRLYDEGIYDKFIPMAKQLIQISQQSTHHKQLYLWISIALAKQKKIGQALQKCKECLEFYPNYCEILLCMANLLIFTNKVNQAKQKLKKIIKLDDKIYHPYIVLGQIYTKSSNYRKAKQLLQPVFQNFNKQKQIYCLLAYIYLQLNELSLSQQIIIKYKQNFTKKDSFILYMQGLILKYKNNKNQAYIMFEQALKYNSHRWVVIRSLLQTIRIQIDLRDFYKAHHTINRIKFLQIQQNSELKSYRNLIQGVMAMMKKKYDEAINILNKVIIQNKNEQPQIIQLTNKYLGYGYFKISNYRQCIIHYEKVKNKDTSSQYNLLLAQGIDLADRQKNYNEALIKFNSSKAIYPLKTQPYIYIAMLIIQKINKDNQQLAESVILALKQLDQGYKLNSSSSNLLYHRSILHLYFQDFQQALKDINRCIQKAQQNLPKYFYIRGVCYSCLRDYKKAASQFSICISLQAKHSGALLEKAKCYFLLGNTQKGFSSLRNFMQQYPQDQSIYKWIGDLLYEGNSYQDALKAYTELNSKQDINIVVMKLKCLLRIGNMQDICSTLKQLQQLEGISKQKINLDKAALSLIQALIGYDKNQIKKGKNTLPQATKKLSNIVQIGIHGYLFQLIDCMNLLGVSSFYLEKYNDAYESFLLVLQLYQSLCQKQTFKLKNDKQEQELDLKAEDIYFNIVICEIFQNNIKQALRMLKQQYTSILSDSKKRKNVQKIIKSIQNQQKNQIIDWQFKNDKPINSKLVKIQLKTSKPPFKTKPVFNLYHQPAEDLYHSTIAQSIVNKLHTGYIDNMPQGPWIRRNPFGVVFTQQMISSEGQLSLDNTFRKSETSQPYQQNENYQQQKFEQQMNQSCKRQQFIKKMKLQAKVQERINAMIQKNQVQMIKKKNN